MQAKENTDLLAVDQPRTFKSSILAASCLCLLLGVAYLASDNTRTASWLVRASVKVQQPLTTVPGSFSNAGRARAAPLRTGAMARIRQASPFGSRSSVAVETRRTDRRAPSKLAASAESVEEGLNFLTTEDAEKVRESMGTPTFVYDVETLKGQASATLAFPNAYGLTVRYAMKSSPTAAILKLFNKMGLHIDASSGYEVERAMMAGIPADHISLSTQEFPSFFEDLVKKGTKINACSLSQLEMYGKAFPGTEVGVRFNPGLGSGGTGKTNVGGPSSSFGIWYELLPQVKEIVEKYDLKVVRIHTHIGSGSDPAVWVKVSDMSLNLVREFETVTTLNLGGGYKVARTLAEKGTDLQVVGEPVKENFVKFAEETGRKIHLEIEPGTFLLANSASLVTTVQDIVTTGSEGHTFIKLDSGMTEVLRPSLYGAQHPLISVPKDSSKGSHSYIVVGHCCESGDLFSCASGAPEELAERVLSKVEIGDLLVVEGVGAYCSSMGTKNYNSFPEAAEVMRVKDGEFKISRKRQTLEQQMVNEVADIDVDGWM